MLGRGGRCPSCLAALKIGSDGALTVPEGSPDPAPARPEAVPLLEPGPGPTQRLLAAPDERPCPLCGEPILVVARKCRHCGEFLDALPVPARPETPPQPAIAFYAMSLVIPLIGLALGAFYLSKPSPACREFGKISMVCSASQILVSCLVSSMWAGVALVAMNLRGAM